jgi:hypothetical protein
VIRTTASWRKLISERGSIMNSLIFIIIGTGVIVAALSFFLLRSTNDYATAQQARVKSAISQLSTNLLGQFNSQFPTSWEDSATDLKAVTGPLGVAPQQQANAWVEAYSFNRATGVIAMQVRGESTQPGHLAVTAEIKMTPSGAAVFTGTDAHGRPTWIYSSADLDSLALWQLSSSIQYITPGGTYSLESPSQIPTVQLAPTDAGADAKIGTVICKYFALTEYQYQVKTGNDNFGAWSAWGSTRTISYPMAEGDHIEFQARARCVNDTGASDPSAFSDIASYSKPFKTVLQGPQVTVTTAGLVSWTTVSCAPGSVEQYQFSTATDDGGYGAWSDWAADRSFTAPVAEGSKLQAQVRAHCATAFVTGPNSTIGSNSAIAPIVTVPAAPTVNLSGTVVARFVASTCPTNTTPELRYEWAKNDAAIDTNSWTGWSPQTQVSFPADEGQRTSVIAGQHCISNYAVGPTSSSSARQSIDTPVISIPGKSTVTLAADGKSFTMSDAVCPTQTTAKYKYSYVVNGGTTVVFTGQWYVNPGAIAISTVNEGGTLSVTAQSACSGYIPTAGPANQNSTTNLTRAITTTPAIPTFSMSATGNSSINASGCPAGTSYQYQGRTARNYGGWNSFDLYDTLAYRNTAVNEGDTVILSANIRCTNPATGAVGPANYGQSGWVGRGVSAPGLPGSIVRSGVSYYGVQWSGAGCAAGTTGDYAARFYRSGSIDTGVIGRGGSPSYNYGASASYSSQLLYYDTYSRCFNPATGIASGWTVRTAHWTGGNSAGSPVWG